MRPRRPETNFKNAITNLPDNNYDSYCNIRLDSVSASDERPIIC